MIAEKLKELRELIGDKVSSVTREFLETTCKIAQQREHELESEQVHLNEQLEHVNAKAEFLNNKNKEVIKQEKSLTLEEEALREDRKMLEV